MIFILAALVAFFVLTMAAFENFVIYKVSFYPYLTSNKR